jgi:hypothetical protein
MGGLKDAIEKSPEELKDALEGKAEETPEQRYERLESEPKMKVEYTFTIDYTDGRGKRWHGEFVNRILSYKLRSRVGAMRASMSGGLPLEALDLPTMEINEKLAHLTISLTARPKWAEGEKLADLLDPKILDLIYSEVASHEATFHGRGPDQETGVART